MPLVGFTENLSKTIEQRVKNFLLVTPSLYRYFQANDLIRNYGGGVDKVTYFDKKKPDGAHMASTIHNANIISPLWGETTVGFLYLVGKIQISKMDADKFRKGQWISGDLVQDTINSVLPVILNQVDQFLSWGDNMKDPVDALDKFRGTSTFTGIFNGGTTLAAGKGADNDVTDEGDYLYTLAQYRKALRNAGHEQASYLVLSDVDTEVEADVATNHFYSTVGVSEYQRVLEKKWVQDWMSSPNFIDNAGTGYRIAMIAPKQMNDNVMPKGINNNFELYQGYNFETTPLHNGGLSSEGYYEWLIEWSGRLVEYNPTAIQRSGTLTITD
jgi:hypothetical protein